MDKEMISPHIKQCIGKCPVCAQFSSKLAHHDMVPKVYALSHSYLDFWDILIFPHFQSKKVKICMLFSSIFWRSAALKLLMRLSLHKAALRGPLWLSCLDQQDKQFFISYFSRLITNLGKMPGLHVLCRYILSHQRNPRKTE